MSPETVSQILVTAASSVLTVSALGAGGWWLFKRAVDQKLAQLLEKQRAELVAAVHRENTVYSRLDQQRADAVQTINAELRAHDWQWREFRPRGDPDEAVAWAMQAHRQAKKVVEATNKHGLLLPPELVENVEVWYLLARGAALRLAVLFGELAQTDAFKNADARARASLLLEIKHRPNAALSKAVSTSLYDSLRLLASTVGPVPAGAVKKVSFDDRTSEALGDVLSVMEREFERLTPVHPRVKGALEDTAATASQSREVDTTACQNIQTFPQSAPQGFPQGACAKAVSGPQS